MCRFIKLILPAMLLIFVGGTAIYAHGIAYTLLDGHACAVKIEYDDGDPVKYTSYKVFSPENHKIEHQNGRTDKNGILAFVPDVPGEWRFEADDGRGHRVAGSIMRKADGTVAETGRGASMGLVQKIIAAVCVVWGALGTALYFRRRSLHAH